MKAIRIDKYSSNLKAEIIDAKIPDIGETMF